MPQRRPKTHQVTDQAPCVVHLDMRVTQRHHLLPRRLAYCVLAGVFVVGMLGTTLPTPLYVLWQEYDRFPAVIITVLFAVFTLGMLTALLFFGRLSDQFGRRPVLLGALGVACASTILFILAQQVLLLLLAGRVLSGFAAGLLTGTVPSGLAELQPAGNLRQAGWLATAMYLGGLGLGPLVAGLFAQFAPSPTQLVFVVYLAVLAMSVLLVGVLLPESVEARDHRLDLHPQLGVTASTAAIFWPAAGTAFCLTTILALFSALAPTFLRTILHAPNLALAGGMVCVLFGAGALSAASADAEQLEGAAGRSDLAAGGPHPHRSRSGSAGIRLLARRHRDRWCGRGSGVDGVPSRHQSGGACAPQG